jgi:hypothetical protein
MEMKMQLLVALALGFGSAAASAAELLDLGDVAQRSGLTVRQVRMVLGAPTSFAEYRTSFRTSEHKVKQVLGEKAYRELAESYRRSEDAARTIAAN